MIIEFFKEKSPNFGSKVLKVILAVGLLFILTGAGAALWGFAYNLIK